MSPLVFKRTEDLKKYTLTGYRRNYSVRKQDTSEFDVGKTHLEIMLQLIRTLNFDTLLYKNQENEQKLSNLIFQAEELCSIDNTRQFF